MGVATLRGADGPAPKVPEQDAQVEIKLVAPLDYEVVQRRNASTGFIRVEGFWNVPRHAAPPDRLEARIMPSAEQDPESEGGWVPMPFDPRSRGFCGELPAKPGGWYAVEVRAARAGRSNSLLTVPHVGVGEVFVIAGQSNSANYGDVRTTPSSGLVAAFDGVRWAPDADPQPGATGTKGSFIPSFGDAMVARYRVPVGVICLGVGSTSVREWLPEGSPMASPPTTGRHVLTITGERFVSTGELFDRLVGALRRQGSGGIRAVLWHQGESDWHQPEGHEISIAEYRDDLTKLIAGSRAAAGWDVPWVVAQASYGNPENRGSEAFRDAQRSVCNGHDVFEGPNTDELGPEFRAMGGRGVHFNAAGLKRHGELWAQAVGRWLDDRLQQNAPQQK